MLMGELEYRSHLDPDDWPKAKSLKGLRRSVLTIVNTRGNLVDDHAWLIPVDKQAVRTNIRRAQVIKSKAVLRTLIILWNNEHPDQRV